jgi:hypothetical protein
MITLFIGLLDFADLDVSAAKASMKPKPERTKSPRKLASKGKSKPQKGTKGNQNGKPRGHVDPPNPPKRAEGCWAFRPMTWPCLMMLSSMRFGRRSVDWPKPRAERFGQNLWAVIREPSLKMKEGRYESLPDTAQSARVELKVS